MCVFACERVPCAKGRGTLMKKIKKKEGAPSVWLDQDCYAFSFSFFVSLSHSLIHFTSFISFCPHPFLISHYSNTLMQYHSQASVRKRLDYYYRAVNAVILNRQNPTTGLIPASVAVTTHGDYRDAWVRYVCGILILAKNKINRDMSRMIFSTFQIILTCNWLLCHV